MSSTSTLIICPRCEHRNRPVARFCARCGDALHEARRVPVRGHTSGSRMVVGLLFIGLVLASFALFARVKPERPLPTNLWNPPDMEALHEREQIREQFTKRARREGASPSSDGDQAENTQILKYRMQGPSKEIVE